MTPAAPLPPADLEALLAPLGAEAFFARYWEREPLHLAAEGRRAAPLLTLEALEAALLARGAPPEGLLAFPEHLRAGAEPGALCRDPGFLRAYLEAGHPIVWNRARGLAPAIDALAASLGEALGGQAWPNVYATGAAGTPFEMHFDNHEVFALQAEGAKEWTVSAVRIDRPLDAPEMAAALRATHAARRAEAEARPRATFRVTVGDLVYVPRGQFHNARTLAGRSLHVTFGVRLLAGFDVAQLLAELALAEPALREYLPAAAADPGGGLAEAQIRAILARLGELLAGDELDQAIRAARAALIRRAGSSGA